MSKRMRQQRGGRLYGLLASARSCSVAGSTIPALLLAGFVALLLVVVVFFLVRGDRSRDSNETNEFAYDIESYLDVDPQLVLYRELSTFPTGLKEPRAVACTEGDEICIVGDEALCLFGPDGESVGQVDLGKPPYCVASPPGGLHYVGFVDHVEVIESGTRKRAASWEPPSESAWFTSIAVSSKEAYVADARGRVIWRYDLEGKLLGKIGQRDPERGVPGLLVPTPYLDVAMAPDGLLRVANPGRHRVEAYTPEGDLELHWGKPSLAIEGFAGCCNPCNFALLPDGGFVTAEKGIPRVKEYTVTGELAGVVAAPRAFVEGHRASKEDWRQGSRGGLDVAVDSKGRVVVLDPLARDVRVFVREKGEAAEDS